MSSLQGRMNRFWIWVQAAIVVMVVAAAVIAIVKLQ